MLYIMESVYCAVCVQKWVSSASMEEVLKMDPEFKTFPIEILEGQTLLCKDFYGSCVTTDVSSFHEEYLAGQTCGEPKKFLAGCRPVFNCSSEKEELWYGYYNEFGRFIAVRHIFG